jgi:hypothetical protein
VRLAPPYQEFCFVLQKLPRKLLPALSSEATPDVLLQLQDDGQPHPAILDLTGLLARQAARDFMNGLNRIEQREGESQ